MLRITCPCCGERDYTEFRYGGDASKPRPAHGTGDLQGLARLCLPVRQPQGSASRISGSMCWAAGSGWCWSAIRRPMTVGASRPAREQGRANDPRATLAPAPGRAHRPQAAHRLHPRRPGASSGFAGDTLASALMAAGVTLVGRSFKYHRPRGLLSAGVEEPNALLHPGRRRPARAEHSRHHDRADARARGAAPERLALGRVRSDGGQFAGRAAAAGGLLLQDLHGSDAAAPGCSTSPSSAARPGWARGTYERDPDRYETRHEFCDVLVVGSGPAGLPRPLWPPGAAAPAWCWSSRIC